MIAVFWDNADFSRGTGTTFYQVGEAILVCDCFEVMGTITGCPERRWVPHPWRHSWSGWMGL